MRIPDFFSSARRRSYCAIAVGVFLVVGVLPSIVRAQDSETPTPFDPAHYNPRLAISVGPAYQQLSAQPEWIAPTYAGGTLTLTGRLFRQFFIEAGKTYSYGEGMDKTSFIWGSHYQVETTLHPYREAANLGFRYEHPLAKNRLRVTSLYGGGGMIWEHHRIRSDSYRYYSTPAGWANGQEGVLETDAKAFTTSDLTGWYIGCAARWRLDPQSNIDPDSWYGHYGVDTGVRYTRYTDATSVRPGYDDAGVFSGIEVFVAFFMKLSLFY